jgi:hypothetical protein
VYAGIQPIKNTPNYFSRDGFQGENIAVGTAK